MTFQDLFDLKGGRIPQLHRSVVICCGNQLAIGAKGDGMDHTSLAFQGVERFTHWPHPNARGLIITGRGQQFSIPPEHGCIDQLCMPNELLL